jgi:hypothetical protein
LAVIAEPHGSLLAEGDCVMDYPKCFLLALLILLVVLGEVFVIGADEVLYWNGVALEIVQQSATHPPKTARDLAIVQAAVYDALNAIDGRYGPLYYQSSIAGPTSQEAAVAAAAHQALVGLYPDYETALNDALAVRLAGIPAGAAKDNGIALGYNVANQMLARRASDGWDVGYDYAGSAEPGKWRPTPPNYLPGLAPQWGALHPFTLPGTEEFRPGPPPALNSPEYAAAFNEVKLLGAANSTTRTPDQTQIAVFWSDYPGATAAPPGKWNLIAQTLAAQQQNTLADNARMFALLNLALADAGIVCWDTKYTYEAWRPEDAIHWADVDGNPDTLADPDWTPLLTTPSFPEYTSGHSTFSGAAAEVLVLFFGTDDLDFEIAAGFGVLPGVMRSFDSLSEAAQEAGLSRIYGGIHFAFANTSGLSSGQAIGAYVYNHFAQPIPAPGAVGLVLLGAACLLRLRRRLTAP